MPSLIIIHGPMCSGKSTITTELQKRLPKYILVDRAYIKDRMLGNLKKENRQLALNLSKKAMFLIAEGLIENGYDILLQEIRLPSVKKHLGDKLKNYKVKSFYLKCSVKTAKKRDLERQDKHVRPETVEEMHRKHAESDDGDVVIDTEIMDLKAAVKDILKNLA